MNRLILLCLCLTAAVAHADLYVSGFNSGGVYHPVNGTSM